MPDFSFSSIRKTSKLHITISQTGPAVAQRLDKVLVTTRLSFQFPGLAGKSREPLSRHQINVPDFFFLFFFTYILVIKNPNLKAWSHRFLSRNERCVYIIWRLPQAWLFLPSLPPNPQRFTRPVIFSSSSQTYGAWSWIFLLSIPATAPCDS